MTSHRNHVIVGDAIHELRRLAGASVDMVLTSPPYFRLRDYDIDGQLGLESHVEQWVAELRSVAAEIHRVLVPTGSLWLNVADTYAVHRDQGAARKSLLLGPERLALALVEDGWTLRNKIVWHKSNPMPTPVRDRLACSWEAVYIFVKQPNYFFDLNAIRQPHTSRATPRRAGAEGAAHEREAWRGPNADDTGGLAALKARGIVGHPLGKNPGDVWRLASSGYRGAHHATFPISLASRAIAAGCPQARCTACRLPWRRRTIRAIGGTAVRSALGPSCTCDAPSEPGVVLDPFFGAGSTGVAAEELQRDWLGIELNPAFARQAALRIAQARQADKRRPAA